MSHLPELIEELERTQCIKVFGAPNIKDSSYANEIVTLLGGKLNVMNETMQGLGDGSLLDAVNIYFILKLLDRIEDLEHELKLIKGG